MKMIVYLLGFGYVAIGSYLVSTPGKRLMHSKACTRNTNLEVVSKPQVRFDGKAYEKRKSGVRLRRMNILSFSYNAASGP